MRSLELKIPPPAVAFVFALFMWLASLLVSPLQAPLAARVAVALALLSIGMSFSISGMVSFRRAKTTMNPMKPGTASSLVSGGVYRFTRNPMYVGLLFDLLAWAAYLSNLAALLCVPVFMLYIHRFQIVPEERALSALFGGEYVAYRQRVRRWL